MSQGEEHALLLQDVEGFKEETHFRGYGKQLKPVTVKKGSLLTRLNPSVVNTLNKNHECLLNYRVDHLGKSLRGDNSLKNVELVYVDSTVLFYLSRHQRDLLLGVTNLYNRLEVLGRLEWVESLRKGAEVYVTIPTITAPVRGIVRYIGGLPCEEGRKFGVELLERKGEGTHDGRFKETEFFKCGRDCAVFVAMDKLTDGDTVKAATVTQTSAPSTLKPASTDKDGVPIRLGDYVTFFDNVNTRHRGVVRWIGTNKSFQPDGTPIVGIEAETNLNLRDVPHNIKDRFIRDYFSSKRSKVFLPIIYVIRDKDNSSPVDKEELPHNTSGALPQECDVKPPQPQSMGRRGSDSQLLSSTRRESDTTTAQPQSLTTISSKHKRHHDYETLQDLIIPESCNQYNLEVGSAVQYMDFDQYGVIKWIGIISGSKDVYAGVEMEDDVSESDRNGELMGVKYFKCKPGKGKFVLLSSLKPDQRKRKFSEGSLYNANQETCENDLHELSVEPNPYNLKVGSVIEYGEPIQYGVIKWMGHLPNEQGLHAGVEMDDDDIDEPHDGTWAGIEYYKCKPNRGMFVLLSGLKSGTRDKARKNQLTSKASTSGSDHKQATSKLVQAQNPYNLEVGSLVHFGDPLKCGVIKWIGIIPGFGEVVQAGLKMDDKILNIHDGYQNNMQYFPGRGRFVDLISLKPCGISVPGHLWTQYDLEQNVSATKDAITLPKDIEMVVLKSVMVLVVTIDKINEASAIRCYLQPLDGHEYIYKYYQDELKAEVIVYHIGKYGACQAAIRNIPPGIVHDNTSCVSMMADQCFPNLGGIVSVGVACGIKGKVEICDVLVSSQIINYDKVREEYEEYSPRGEAIAVSSQFNTLFTQPVQWPSDAIKKRLNNSGQHTPYVKSGVILSGPYLVDPIMKKTLAKNFAHEAIGIEMDGAHLFIANHHIGANIIIVKAVCDFGDGKNIKMYQPTAALLAADLVHKCLSNPQAPAMLKGKMLLRQMLQQAKNEGLTVNVRHAKILFCGAAKAGKSSFSRLLRNEEHEKVYKSTPAGDSQQVLISEKVNEVGTKVNVIDSNWISLDSKLETQQITNRLILKLQKQKDITNKDRLSSRNDDAGTNSSIIASDSECLATNVPSNQPTVTEDTDSSNHSPSNKELNESVPDDNIQANTQISIEEQMVTCTDNVNASVSELVEAIPETWDLFTLLDTGGQPEFINLLPAINSSTAITFVVLNISEGKNFLNNLVTAQYQCEGYDYGRRKLKYTNKHLLKCLLSSVKVSAMKKDNFNPEIVKKLTEDEHPKPVVCIIGTCADLLKEKFGENYCEEVVQINEEVQKLVKIIKDKDVVFWCKGLLSDRKFVIPVDNTISREPQDGFECETVAEIQRIREHSNEVLKKKAQYEIPISWFILELELRNNDKVCIPLIEVKDICDRIMPPHRRMNFRQIREVLKFYHLYGMLLYFSEVDGMDKYVITNPEWLFLNLTKIIMCRFVNNPNDLYDSYLIDQMDKGICSMELLKRLELDLKGIELTSFVNLLKFLKVVAPVKTMENAYFIPNVLPPCDENYKFMEEDYGKPAAYAVDGKCIHPQVEPLLIEFTFGTIPRGLFGSLIVQLLQDNPDTYELCENDHMLCQYADLILFFVKPHWHVSLRDKISYLELQVRVNGKKPSYHYEVQTAVTKALNKVCEDFNWHFGDCRYGFVCRMHTEDSQNVHLTLLSDSQPFPDVIPEDTCCKNWPRKSTSLNKAHTIWLENVQKISKSPDMLSEPIVATTVPPSADVESEILNKTPEMFDLMKIVIPEIMNEWEYIAYALRYNITTIKAIKERERENPKKCCEEFFMDWLTTGNGAKAGPKVWSTLINALIDINISADIIKKIIVKVKQLKC